MPSYATRGRDTTLYVDGVRASGYFNEYENESERDDLEFTPFEAEDKEYLGGAPAENNTTLTGSYNGDAGGVDDTLEDAYSAGSVLQLLVCPGGILSSKKVLMLGDATVKKIKTSGKSDDINEFEAEIRSKRQRGVMLKTPVAVSATGNGTQNLYTVGGLPTTTNFGGVFSLHVEAIGGTVAPTAVVISIEHSTDGTTWAALTGATFADVAVGYVGRALRLETLKTLPINGYVRAKHTITGGTSPSVNYSLAFHRRLHA